MFMPFRNYFSVFSFDDLLGRNFQNFISVSVVTIIKFWRFLDEEGEAGSRKIVSEWYSMGNKVSYR